MKAQTEDKNINNDTVPHSKFWSLLKFIFVFVFIILTLLAIAHLAVNYGVEFDKITNFIQKTWYIWLAFRIVIYGIIIIFINKLVKISEQYKSLFRPLGVAVAIIELTSLIQLLQG
ncbi:MULTISPECIES: hypothetical protein [Pasteurellaceae]|uniref:Uncharacterized protein n=1 Tax=Glaesserella australis TaxID=2094024 RepID=A0A328BUL0_9PAST|nr:MULTISPECIES: hypothetical protein [Pasteurellaceae]AUI65866.1 hypothetical protein CJD39_04435 [Glaesserella sp. 15-184]RAL17988.1 hypothetical protein C5N92_10145 [Glaesserella australis]HDX1003762.1 hypothetical protein [Pasteurella multocida]